MVPFYIPLFKPICLKAASTFMILFSTFSFPLTCKDNAIVQVSQAITKEDKSIGGFAMPLVILQFFLLVTNFFLISNASVSPDQAFWINTSGEVKT